MHKLSGGQARHVAAGRALADDISQFHDHYRDALEELIEAKSEGKEPAARTVRRGTCPGEEDCGGEKKASSRKPRSAGRPVSRGLG
ncbi:MULTISPECIES: hypothetical protein [unclassified Streptomyces]|uniref:hypothetical protein n=1 Tax=unclassified Streptomyces TaxID=2593676 RepID=UPI0035DCC33C